MISDAIRTQERKNGSGTSMTRLQLLWSLLLVAFLVVGHFSVWAIKDNAIDKPDYPTELIGVLLVAGGLTFVGGKREDRLQKSN